MLDKRNSFPRKIRPAKIAFFALMMLAFVAAMGLLVMLLWNWILPDVLNVKKINFWQAAGMFVLFRILFGGFRRGRGWGGKSSEKRAHWKNKWMNMTDEERVEFKDRWKKRCGK